MAWFSSLHIHLFLYLLFCLSCSKPQTVSDRGQEEVHATILDGNRPNSAEPTSWHHRGFRSNAA